MKNVKYSIEFNARQVARIIGEKGLSSIALVSTLRSSKIVDTFQKSLLDEVAQLELKDVSITVCPDFLRNGDSVLACEQCDNIILLEKYGKTTHRGLDELLDILQSQNRTIIGVVAVK